ncbi:MAG TPA: nucleotidyltransferase domain-containing protein [Terriglobia bacterium]|nr:nucleotidyltransferase domain-containing protein [Terriglobia bacterium]
MNAMVEQKVQDLSAICNRRAVCRLALFGSAASGPFDPASSDLDFLVEFQPLSPTQHADQYFGLQEDLEHLFGMPVELVEPGPIRNPYFRQAIEKTQVLLYAAA